jgi:3-phenylpropionate/cinnamic acid dioxygenase small subunit
MTFEDHYEIERLIYKYPELTDTGDFDGVGRLFTHCAQARPSGEIRPAVGAAAYAEHYAGIVRRYPDSGTPKTRHVVSNVAIELDGAPDRARARSYFTVLQQTAELPLQVICSGTYFDKFAKVDGEWRFVERGEDIELQGDFSGHLLHAME